MMIRTRENRPSTIGVTIPMPQSIGWSESAATQFGWLRTGFASFAAAEAQTADPTIFVVDPDPESCQAVVDIASSLGLRAMSFASGQEFLDSYSSRISGCLVLDVHPNDMTGLELQRRMASSEPELPILMVGSHVEVRTVVAALQAGAMDFVEKPLNKQVLARQIQEAIRRNAKNRSSKARREEISARLARLTRRERQVMELMVAGNSTKQIAVMLGISYKTVSIHHGRVIEKMRANSLAELLRMVMIPGLSMLATDWG